ncbi:hypothetical protein EOK98_00545, partial [Klebsiella pneumoniae]
ERSQIAFPIPSWPVAPLLTLLFMGLVIAVLGISRRHHAVAMLLAGARGYRGRRRLAAPCALPAP